MVESSPSRQRQPPCKTKREMSDEAADTVAHTYLLTLPRSSFVPRTAQPPYSQVETSTRAGLDGLRLTARRAMVDVEPYGSSDFGGDLWHNEPPSLSPASPSDDDDPEDPENASDKKKEKKRKSRPHQRRPSKEAKAIATTKIVVKLPEFTGNNLSEFAECFCRFLKDDQKCQLLLQCC